MNFLVKKSNFALQFLKTPAHNGPFSRPLYSRFPPPLPPIPHPLPPIPHPLSPYPRPPPLSIPSLITRVPTHKKYRILCYPLRSNSGWLPIRCAYVILRVHRYKKNALAYFETSFFVSRTDFDQINIKIFSFVLFIFSLSINTGKPSKFM